LLHTRVLRRKLAALIGVKLLLSLLLERHLERNIDGTESLKDLDKKSKEDNSCVAAFRGSCTVDEV
jgi:hypothetical protein